MQKSGRLTARRLAHRCVAALSARAARISSGCTEENMPFHVPRARDHDIPDLARENVCALGPSARNVLEEERLQPKSRGVAAGSEALCTLKFGRCRIAPAIPEGVVLARAHPSRASALRPLFHTPPGDYLRRHFRIRRFHHALAPGQDRATSGARISSASGCRRR